MAAVGFILPSFLIVSFLSFLYFRFHQLPELQAALRGTNPVIIALILVAAISMGRKIRGTERWGIALLAFALAGMLASSESAPNKPTALPSGQMQTIDLAELVNEWPGQLYNAILFPSSQQPPSTGVTHIPPPDLSPDGFAWRNLAYALQWWIFALFALYMWWRMVREEHDREQLEAANAASGEDDAAAPLRVPADEENKERSS